MLVIGAAVPTTLTVVLTSEFGFFCARFCVNGTGFLIQCNSVFVAATRRGDGPRGATADHLGRPRPQVEEHRRKLEDGQAKVHRGQNLGRWTQIGFSSLQSTLLFCCVLFRSL